MANNSGSVQDKGKDLASSASQAASDIKNKAQDFGSAAMNQAKDAASNLAGKAKDAASYAGQKAEDATSAVGSGMKSLAGQVRQNAPQEGVLGSAASSVAGALDSTGKYISEQGMSGMADDFTGLIRRNPIPALLIGVAFGFLIARATSSRS